jgi:uncharacterized protein (DUF1778 family)
VIYCYFCRPNRNFMSKISAFYQSKIDQYEATVKIIRRKIVATGLLRMLVFVPAVLSLYFYFHTGQKAYLWLFIFFALAFLLLIKISFRLKDNQLLKEKLLFLNVNEWKVLHDEPNQFKDGKPFQSKEGYLEDLDIFGPNSIFHLLNRASTIQGEEKLAFMLSNCLATAQEIEAYQQAIRMLTPQVEERQLLTGLGLANEPQNNPLSSLKLWLEIKNQLKNKIWLRFLGWLLPAFNLTAIYLFVVIDEARFLVAGSLLSLGITLLFTRYISAQHQLLSKKQQALGQYSSILNQFTKISIGSSQILKRHHSVSIRAHLEIRRLTQLAQLFDQRLNLMVNFFFNALFMYDIHCTIALEKWKEKNRDNLTGWIDTIADIEYLNSLANFAYNNPDYVYPQVSSQKLLIEAKDLGHPLIPKAERVVNDFGIGFQEKIQLITGSNMSGKTTFLRAVGANLVLAQMGAPVCASSFRFCPMGLLSSVHVNDSLQERTSYFMAELKRLQQIVNKLQEGTGYLLLIDEILRGTNSEDKTRGSEKFITKLLQFNCIGLFATHDLNLIQLEKQFPESISNYCFESVLKDGELEFDYRLRAGIAKNKNATFLMEKMGIV